VLSTHCKRQKLKRIRAEGSEMQFFDGALQPLLRILEVICSNLSWTIDYAIRHRCQIRPRQASLIIESFTVCCSEVNCTVLEFFSFQEYSFIHLLS
jgi:hypothetical protein